MAQDTANTNYLMRGLLHGFYWCDESLQNFLKAAGKPELSRTKSMIMVNISDGITRPSDLARNIGISRQAIQQTLVEMEKMGLITLAPDPSDGRAKIVKFSRRGSGIGKAAFEAMDAIETELIKRLGANSVKDFKKVLLENWGPVLQQNGENESADRKRVSIRRSRAKA
jgi:DNA-binding MarR family transcriptional regulator